MDPTDPTAFNHRFVKVASGHRYHLIDQAPLHHRGPISEAPTLLLAHGFPDSWYGWRYQIKAFAAEGWRVLCPSQIGYGESDAPVDVAAYGFKSVAYDMASLLDECGVPGKIVVVGHDWGGMVAWRFCNYFPHKVIAVACVCTPYQAPTDPSVKPIPDEILIRKYLPNFGYQLFFQERRSEEILGEVLDLFLAGCHSPNYRRGRLVPAEHQMATWVKEGKLEASLKKQIEERRAGNLPHTPPERELDVVLDLYARSGLRGPLNWYRTRRINFDDEQAANLPAEFPAHIPALQLPAESDPALPPSMCTAPAVLKCFPAGNLEIKMLKGADHWCLQDEKVRDNVTDILITWIRKVLDGKWEPSPARSNL